MRWSRFLLIVLLIGSIVYVGMATRTVKDADVAAKRILEKTDKPDVNTEEIRSFSISGFSESGDKIAKENVDVLYAEYVPVH